MDHTLLLRAVGAGFAAAANALQNGVERDPAAPMQAVRACQAHRRRQSIRLGRTQDEPGVEQHHARGAPNCLRFMGLLPTFLIRSRSRLPDGAMVHADWSPGVRRSQPSPPLR
jgi:hypothetical protein